MITAPISASGRIGGVDEEREAALALSRADTFLAPCPALFPLEPEDELDALGCAPVARPDEVFPGCVAEPRVVVEVACPGPIEAPIVVGVVTGAFWDVGVGVGVGVGAGGGGELEPGDASVVVGFAWFNSAAQMEL